jgi:hypothetical protein
MAGFEVITEVPEQEAKSILLLKMTKGPPFQVSPRASRT